MGQGGRFLDRATKLFRVSEVEKKMGISCVRPIRAPGTAQQCVELGETKKMPRPSRTAHLVDRRTIRFVRYVRRPLSRFVSSPRAACPRGTSGRAPAHGRAPDLAIGVCRFVLAMPTILGISAESGTQPRTSRARETRVEAANVFRHRIVDDSTARGVST